MKKLSLSGKGTVAVLLLSLTVLILSACGPSGYGEQGAPETVQGGDQNVINAVYPVLKASTGYPMAEMKVSMERIGLRERLLRFNQWNKIGYVTLAWPMGGFAGYFTIRGKVSSTDSQLTSVDQVEYRCPKAVSISYQYCSWLILHSPEDDGSWGGNEGGQNGVFFFTNTDVLIETVFPWLYADAPVRLTDQKYLVFDVKPGDTEKPSSVGEPLDVRKKCAEQGIGCSAQTAPPLPTPVPTRKP